MPPSAGGPPRLTNPYASVDPDERPGRTGLAAGRALVAGVIGLGAVAVLTGTAAADEPSTDATSSELTGTDDSASASGSAQQGGEDGAGDAPAGATGDGDGSTPPDSSTDSGSTDSGTDDSGTDSGDTESSTGDGNDDGSGDDGSGDDGSGDDGSGDDAGSGSSGGAGTGGPRALTLPEGEITLSDEARQDAADRARADRQESPSGERRLTGVPVGQDRLTVQDGGFSVGSPRLDLGEADVDLTEDGEVSVTGIQADLGTAGFEGGGRDPESGLTFRTENTVTLDPRDDLRVDLPDGPDQPEADGATGADGGADADTGAGAGDTGSDGEPEAPDSPERLRVQSETAVGFTTAPDDPVQAGVTAGISTDVTLSNGEEDVQAQGTFATPVRAYAGFSEAGDEGEYSISAEAVYAERAAFGPDGDDQSSVLDISAEATGSVGPDLNAEGTGLTEDGVRAEGFVRGRYTEVDDQQMTIPGATPGSTLTIETDQRSGQVTAGGSVTAQAVERSDDGWDVDLGAQLRGQTSFVSTELTTDDIPAEPVRTEGVSGEAGIRADARFGDLGDADGDLLFGEVGGEAGVTYADGADTEADAAAWIGVGGRAGDVSGELRYTVATDEADGTPRGGLAASVTAEDLVGPADVELSYRETADDDRVAVQVRFDGDEGGSSSEEADQPESSGIDLSASPDDASPAFAAPGDEGDGDVAIADFSLAGAEFGAAETDAGPGTAAGDASGTTTGGTADGERAGTGPAGGGSSDEPATGTAADLLGVEPAGIEIVPAPDADGTSSEQADTATAPGGRADRAERQAALQAQRLATLKAERQATLRAQRQATLRTERLAARKAERQRQQAEAAATAEREADEQREAEERVAVMRHVMLGVPFESGRVPEDQSNGYRIDNRINLSGAGFDMGAARPSVDLDNLGGASFGFTSFGGGGLL